MTISRQFPLSFVVYMKDTEIDSLLADPAAMLFSHLTILPTSQLILADKKESEFSDVVFQSCLLLKTIKVSDCCFSYLRNVSFQHLPILEQLIIQQDCFTPCRRTSENCVYSRNFGTKVLFLRKTCTVSDCPRLKQITIEKGSFQDFRELKLEKLPVLEECVIGDLENESDCFYYCSFAIFQGMNRKRSCIISTLFGFLIF